MLRRRNPLAKIAGPAPAMAFLVLTRDPWTPGVFLAATGLLLAVASGIGAARLLRFAAVGAAAAVVMTASLSLFVAPARGAGTAVMVELGPFVVTGGQVGSGAATALRMLALLALVLVGGLTTEGPDLVRALVAQLRMPYRVGYAALAAYRFVPRFGHELATIRAAHRVRGVVDSGPLRRVREAGRVAVPLLAGGIRHAERVALAMDARAFGAHPQRTERRLLRFTPADTAFVVGFWAVSVALVLLVVRWGLLAPLVVV